MFLGAAGAQLVRKLCLMVRTHVNICGNDKRLKHRTSPSSKTHAVLFEFMRKASAYLIFNWRRGWDSNPRSLAGSPVFKTGAIIQTLPPLQNKHPYLESNQDHSFRRAMFSPLNYTGKNRHNRNRTYIARFVVVNSIH